VRILVTNDDGIFADGIRHLAEVASELGEVVVVAPDREQSASSHSLTLNRPLRIREVETDRFAVDGTPTDCVNLAVQNLLQDRPADLVLSGINAGLNLGDDVTYSGTVSATFEANLLGLPGIAFSQDTSDGFSFETAGDLVREVLKEVLAEGLQPDLLLNVNFPAQARGGVRLTRLGHRHYMQTVTEKHDPKGRKYYWIGGTPKWEKKEGTDQVAVSEGYVSLTPLHLDLTDYPGLESHSGLAERLHELGAGRAGENG
jgi:5'-nucleotidase